MATDPQELAQAVEELHDYLSDRIAPLMVVDAIGVLLQQQPARLAEHIEAWIGGQKLEAPMADYLYHGARKIAAIGEFGLVEQDQLRGYLRSLGVALLPYCPEGDRDLLKQNLERLASTVAVKAPSSGKPMLRPAQPTAPAAAPQTATREGRRLSHILQHLLPSSGTDTAPAAVEQRSELASQFISAAAVQAKSAKELDEGLAPLKQVGIATDTVEVFRTLAKSLAGWLLPRGPDMPHPVPPPGQVEAMRKVVSLADSPAEAAGRFREMVHAAVEQFNEGQLGRAVTMYELAEKLAQEGKVQPIFVDPIRLHGHDQLDATRLNKLAERTDARSQLRVVLGFYNSLRPDGLLKDIDGEPKRDRRHQLLALLEAHEQDARAAAWTLLQQSVAEGAHFDPFFQMNLVYLLRVIPRPESASVEDEVNVVMRVAGRDSPPPLVKQIIAYFAATRHEKAEKALGTYLRVFESMLLTPAEAVYQPDDLEVLLDRTCAALARYGSPRACRLLIDHGLKSESRLGSTFMRLAEAGRLDLSSSRDLVERLISSIKTELPRGGMLGFASKTNEEKIASLVRALAGTPLPEVSEVLQDVSTRFSDRKFGEAAKKALVSLASVGKPPPPPAGISGDLDLFGLPNLLQTLQQAQLTGILTLLDVQGRAQATLLFERGKFRGGQFGIVLGEEAVLQLLERPFPGTFAFVSRPDLSGQPRASEPQEIFDLLMEGVRRHDELKVAAAVVPDHARLKASGKAHTCLSDEDPDFALVVWKQAASGRTALECESAISTDSYRVRRLLAHWVDEGALAPAA